MQSDRGTMSEQASLLAAATGDDAWLDRMIDFEPTTRVAETFVLNSLVTDVPVAMTRLIAPEALERVGEWLAQTLASDTEPPPGGFAVCERADLTNQELYRLLDLGQPGDLPSAYAGWRLGTELYALIDDLVVMLADDGFVRYRRLDEEQVSAVFSGQLTPFLDFGDTFTGRVVLLTAVPNRLAALGGLRGYRRALVAVGEAMGDLSARWAASEPATVWSWHTEFVDDTCARVFGWDGIERIPLAMAYQQQAPSADADEPNKEATDGRDDS